MFVKKILKDVKAAIHSTHFSCSSNSDWIWQKIKIQRLICLLGRWWGAVLLTWMGSAVWYSGKLWHWRWTDLTRQGSLERIFFTLRIPAWASMENKRNAFYGSRWMSSFMFCLGGWVEFFCWSCLFVCMFMSVCMGRGASV